MTPDNMTPDIAQKHGNILVGTFRKIYGNAFAKGVGPTAKLSVAFESLDSASRSQIEKDAKDGTLDEKVRKEVLS